MRAHNDAGRRTRRRLKSGAVGAAALVVLTGCSAEVQQGWMPGTRETTNHNAELIDLWVNSWIAALVIGLLAWGAMIWCMIAYRRRKNDQGFPKQTAYNVPIETMFTLIPVLLVFTLWGFSDRVQASVDEPIDDSPLTVTVYGKQWSWDFNYEYEGQQAHYSGVQAQLNGEEGVRDTLPTLYLPKDVPVHFELKSRDVAHSFWIPQFLQKRDMIPGKTNHLYLTPQELGRFDGKCAELCGEFHSEMMFNVEVVDEAEFTQKLDEMEPGLVGDEYNRNPNNNPDGAREMEVDLQTPRGGGNH
ncbi:cytochrome c oxidase subunit II [Micrococcus sp. 2A]|uniref:aa3-type cytochrome oxidase subunit II n=1 Tax=Micrococcus TaxID=1269 RepID=UPI00200543E7|nr:cytochrome c oxidase subunit II [Micrococcus sp. M4NT]MDX2340445.1 cytochrome c oxidase subunit II [Micrococcus sp. M4NT]